MATAKHASLSDLATASKRVGTSSSALPGWLARIAMPVSEIEIWRAYLDPGTRPLVQCTELLSADERLRADRFYFERDRRRFIVARGTLRILLGSYLDTLPAGISFGYANHGKPYVARPAARIHFNLSHSEEWVLYAISKAYPVGVDIEYLNREVEYHRIAQRFFTQREAAALQQLPESGRKHAFLACWTCKEAVIKTIGTGLSLPLAQVEVTITPDSVPHLPTFSPIDCETANCTLYSARLDNDYIAAVAVQRHK